MVRPYDPTETRRRRPADRLLLNKPVFDHPTIRPVTPEAWLSSSVAFPPFARIGPTTPKVRRNQREACGHGTVRKHVETVRMDIFGFGSLVIYAHVDDKGTVATARGAFALNADVISVIMAGMYDRPNWLPDVAGCAEAELQLRRMVVMLSALVAAYHYSPGGDPYTRPALLAAFAEPWVAQDGTVLDVNTRADVCDWRTWGQL